MNRDNVDGRLILIGCIFAVVIGVIAGLAS